jgi:hypothetical protein
VTDENENEDDEKPKLETMPGELDMLIRMFERDNGRMPMLGDLMMMREAIASVALDKGDDQGTYAVATEGGAYTAHHPRVVPGQEAPVEEEHMYTAFEVREAQRRAYTRGRIAEAEGVKEKNPYE